CSSYFFFQAEDGIRDFHVTGVQTCALPILHRVRRRPQETPGRGRCPAASRTLQEAGLRKVTFFGNFSGALPATEWRRQCSPPESEKILAKQSSSKTNPPRGAGGAELSPPINSAERVQKFLSLLFQSALASDKFAPLRL